MKCVRAVVFALVFFAPVAAQAAPLLPGAPDTLPLLYLCVNDECLDLSGVISRLPGEKVTFGIDGLEVLFTPGQVLLSAIYNPDPFISFTVTTTNAVVEPVKYSLLFGTFIVPGDYGFATSSGNLSVTNGVGTATVDNSNDHPAYISGYGSVDAEPTTLGVDLGTAPCTAGPGLPSTMTTPCPQGSTSDPFDATFYNNLEVLLTYTQAGLGSVANFSGQVTLLEEDPNPDPNPVPEPTLLALFGLAVFGLGAKRLRR